MEESTIYKGYRIDISTDEWAEDPTTWGNYTIKHFDNAIERDEYIEENADELQKQLAESTAFWLDKYEHSGVSYSLTGQGIQDRFDTSHGCSLLFFTDEYASNAETPEVRRELAKGTIEEYNLWANGEVYNSYVYDQDGDEIDGCGNIYGYEYAVSMAKDTIDRLVGAPPSHQPRKTAKYAGQLHN